MKTMTEAEARSILKIEAEIISADHCDSIERGLESGMDLVAEWFAAIARERRTRRVRSGAFGDALGYISTWMEDRDDLRTAIMLLAEHEIVRALADAIDTPKRSDYLACYAHEVRYEIATR